MRLKHCYNFHDFRELDDGVCRARYSTISTALRMTKRPIEETPTHSRRPILCPTLCRR